METRPPVCASIHPRLEAWSRETLPEAERQAITAHLRECAACRAAAATIDPSVIFLEARGGALPDSFRASFDAALRARLLAESRRPAAARLGDRVAAALAEARAGLHDAFRPAVWMAPAAVATVLLVTLAVLRPVAPPQIARAPRPDGIPSPYAAPRVRPDVPTGTPATSGASPAPAGDAIPEPPTLEQVASPSARVYRFDTAGQDATPIYFVVDESIEF